MPSMGSAAPSPKVLSPPLGSRQKPPEDCGKRGALAASPIFPPPAAHAAGLAAGGGGGGGPWRGSSPLLHAARRRKGSAASESEVRDMTASGRGVEGRR